MPHPIIPKNATPAEKNALFDAALAAAKQDHVATVASAKAHGFPAQPIDPDQEWQKLGYPPPAKVDWARRCYEGHTAKLREQIDQRKRTAALLAEYRAAHPQPVKPTTPAKPTRDQLWDEYHSLLDPVARRAFWLKHKSELR